MVSANTFLNGKRVIAVGDGGFGDGGKGKFVDLFAASWADVIARGTGGANAGHTIEAGGRKVVCHLLPSGILHDKPNVIGSGVAFDPSAAIAEIAELRSAGISCENLKIALNAKLVLPQHLLLDRVREAAAKKGRIGTTGRGIGPLYEDHAARVGLVVNDMLNLNVFAPKLKRNSEEKIRLLGAYDPEIVKTILHQELLGGGKFYHSKKILDLDAIIETYRHYGSELRSFIRDTDAMVREMAAAGRRILLEGAQGTMISLDYGTYPYVTSSDCTVRGLAKGVGLRESDVDLSLTIFKAFYTTRVGEGPFPTEIGGRASEEHCRAATREAEAAMGCGLAETDEFRLGIGVRQAGNEYGATTGRARRTGWLDLPLMRYAAQFSGRNVVMTKLDVLDGVGEVKICTSYIYEGPDYVYGDRVVSAGEEIVTAIPDLEVMRHCEPQYEVLPGWQGPIGKVREGKALPKELRRAIAFVEREADLHVVIASVGPDREDTIILKEPV